MKKNRNTGPEKVLILLYQEDKMEHLNNLADKIKLVVGVIGGLICKALGGWDLTLKVLVCFLVTDYTVGVIAGFINEELDSKVGFRGICKKVLLLVPVGISYALDLLMNVDVLRNMSVMFYIANEGISILENLAKADILIPAALRKKLVQLQEQEKKEEFVNEDSTISRS